MVSKNSEAQKCANTLGLSSNKSDKGNIDMHIVAKSDFNFQGKALVPVSNITGTWLTSSDLAKALEYSNSRAVTMIYNKYADEFSSGMTQVLEVSTSGNYRKKVRVFSLRGAHLIAMFSRTDVAKEFRRWVLDILDREVAHSPIAKQFTDEELINLSYMWIWMDKSQRVSKAIYPAMKQIGSTFSGYFYDMGHETRYMTEKAREALIRETANIDKNGIHACHAAPMLDKLNGKKELH
ncbi:P22AR C-terminal domain-containing protein [Serratia sp. JSRIV004]|uniref:P22AR C-terminal domain-containing protein n=1 Tax=Serratia sp. JSRIV004 TaxID=2831895 RepID=UPI001CBE45A6|nr:P22AR C-terminal domain-containing protein [Serratia sp. JSRIV004]